MVGEKGVLKKFQRDTKEARGLEPSSEVIRGGGLGKTIEKRTGKTMGRRMKEAALKRLILIDT